MHSNGLADHVGQSSITPVCKQQATLLQLKKTYQLMKRNFRGAFDVLQKLLARNFANMSRDAGGKPKPKEAENSPDAGNSHTGNSVEMRTAETSQSKLESNGTVAVVDSSCGQPRVDTVVSDKDGLSDKTLADTVAVDKMDIGHINSGVKTSVFKSNTVAVDSPKTGVNDIKSAVTTSDFKSVAAPIDSSSKTGVDNTKCNVTVSDTKSKEEVTFHHTQLTVDGGTCHNDSHSEMVGTITSNDVQRKADLCIESNEKSAELGIGDSKSDVESGHPWPLVDVFPSQSKVGVTATSNEPQSEVNSRAKSDENPQEVVSSTDTGTGTGGGITQSANVSTGDARDTWSNGDCNVTETTVTSSVTVNPSVVQNANLATVTESTGTSPVNPSSDTRSQMCSVVSENDNPSSVTSGDRNVDPSQSDGDGFLKIVSCVTLSDNQFDTQDNLSSDVDTPVQRNSSPSDVDTPAVGGQGQTEVTDQAEVTPRDSPNDSNSELPCDSMPKIESCFTLSASQFETQNNGVSQSDGLSKAESSRTLGDCQPETDPTSALDENADSTHRLDSNSVDNAPAVGCCNVHEMSDKTVMSDKRGSNREYFDSEKCHRLLDHAKHCLDITDLSADKQMTPLNGGQSAVEASVTVSEKTKLYVDPTVILDDNPSTAESTVIRNDGETKMVSSVILNDSESKLQSAVMSDDSQSEPCVTQNHDQSVIDLSVIPNDSETVNVSSVTLDDSQFVLCSAVMTDDGQHATNPPVVLDDGESKLRSTVSPNDDQHKSELHVTQNDNSSLVPKDDSSPMDTSVAQTHSQIATGLVSASAELDNSQSNVDDSAVTDVCTFGPDTSSQPIPMDTSQSHVDHSITLSDNASAVNVSTTENAATDSLAADKNALEYQPAVQAELAPNADNLGSVDVVASCPEVDPAAKNGPVAGVPSSAADKNALDHQPAVQVEPTPNADKLGSVDVVASCPEMDRNGPETGVPGSPVAASSCLTPKPADSSPMQVIWIEDDDDDDDDDDGKDLAGRAQQPRGEVRGPARIELGGESAARKRQCSRVSSYAELSLSDDSDDGRQMLVERRTLDVNTSLRNARSKVQRTRSGYTQLKFIITCVTIGLVLSE